jgi:N-acetylglutamate synthase-like GNAT family acetyltransferase
LRVTLRPATADDFLVLNGGPPASRCLGFTAISDDKLLGLGALIFGKDGSIWASCIITDDGRKYPLAIHRAGLALMRMARERGFSTVFARAQDSNPAAERWLKRLGFHPIDGANFVWRREWHNAD